MAEKKRKIKKAIICVACLIGICSISAISESDVDMGTQFYQAAGFTEEEAREQSVQPIPGDGIA